MKVANDELGRSIELKRKGLGLSKIEFAEILEIRQNGEQVVSNWENGTLRPSNNKIALIERLPQSPLFKKPVKSPTEIAPFSFIDLFAGIGGIRIPFEKLGGECVFTSEWDRFSKRTYAANFGHVPNGDITCIAAEDIAPHDLLLAGFPCQAFSQAGHRRGFNDTRGTMFFEIQRILAHHRPKAFLLENVKQLRGHDKGRTLRTILDILSGTTTTELPEEIQMTNEARASLCNPLNYQVGFKVLKAAHFGVPQNRERIYIIGFDRDQIPGTEQRNVAQELLDELSKVRIQTRLGDILDEPAKIDEKYTISDKLYAGHKRRLRIHQEKGNGFGYSIFNEHSAYTNTLSARYYKDGSEILIDQSHLGKNPRKLTPNECRKLQGFPKGFHIGAVSDTQIYRQFGNSVAVPVIEEIAERMKSFLLN